MQVGPAMSPYVSNTTYGGYADIRFSLVKMPDIATINTNNCYYQFPQYQLLTFFLHAQNYFFSKISAILPPMSQIPFVHAGLRGGRCEK